MKSVYRTSIHDRCQEAAGLLLVAFGFFLALALWTFHPDDPSWNDRVGAGWVVRNYGGRIGAYFAGGLAHLLGAFATLAPFGAGALGLWTFAGVSIWRPRWRALGWLTVFLSAAGLFSFSFAFDPIFGKTALPGGMVGYGVSAFVGKFLGEMGGAILLAALFLSALVATTGFSIRRLFSLSLSSLRWVCRWLWPSVCRAGSVCAKAGWAICRRSGLFIGRGGIAACRRVLGFRRLFGGVGRIRALVSRERKGEPAPRFVEPEGSLQGRRERGTGTRKAIEEAAPEVPRNGHDQRMRERGGIERVAHTFLPGPAAEGEGERRKAGALLLGPAAAPLPKGDVPAIPWREEGRTASRPREGCAEEPVSSNVLTPAVPAKPAEHAASREISAKGGLRVGRKREEKGFFEKEVPPARSRTGEAPDSVLRGPGADGPPAVRHAGKEGEPEAIRIEDESIVSDDGVGGEARVPSSSRGKYVLPSLGMFSEGPVHHLVVDEEGIREKTQILERTLHEFGVEGRVAEVKTGPVLTIFEFAPAPGVKVSKIAALSDDLARVLSALSVRIVAPIPGTSVVGIEVPQERRQAVYLKEVFCSEEFARSEDKLVLGLGKDILGRTALTDLTKIPHLLIAGTTGSGKSVALNGMICSLLVRCMPREVRLILIDPKMLELSVYDGVPHLLVPVVTDAKKAAAVLRGVTAEMEDRYRRMAQAGVRSIVGYNEWVAEQLGPREARRRWAQPLSPTEGAAEELDFLPYVVVVIDELADLMMVSSRDVEETVTRLAQMARAAGIHLLAATQRPSVDVLTGLIKANFPSRIALRVATRTDSRTILDANGAERLLGKGDMLFVPPGTSSPIRIHGSYVSEKEIRRLVGHWKVQGETVYREEIFLEKAVSSGEDGFKDEEFDERYDDAVALVARTREASISLIQRHLRVGYNRAARMIERMEQEGVIGPSDGVKRREVLIPEIPSG